MAKERRRKNKWGISQKEMLLFGVIFLFSFICFFGLQMMLPRIQIAGYPGKDIVLSLNGNWRCVSPSGGESVSDLPVKMEAKKGERCTISRELPAQLPSGAALCFRSYNQSVYVSVDGKTVYSYDTGGQLPFFEDTPSAWHFVPLDEERGGETVEIALVSPYRYESGYFSEVLLGSRDDLLAKTTSDHIIEYIISISLLFSAVLMILFSLCLVFLRRKALPVFSLGAFVLLAALWLRVECHVPEIFWLNYAAEHWLSFAALMLMPLAYILYICDSMHPRFAKQYHRLFLLIFFSDLIRLLLQVTSLADLAETQLLTIVPVLLLFVVLLREMTEKYKENVSYSFHVAVFGTIVFILSIIAEMAAHLFYLYHEPIHGGSLFSFGLLIYVVCVIFSALLRWFSDQRKMSELERQLTDQRLTMMAGQMRPHFLSNTLSSIQELCYTDPEQAADAIVTFSTYLRTNIDFLGLREPVSFDKEYRYICDYMKIEEMRFGEELCFFTDVDTTDFKIPALTIQPLVENAVRHGIRGRVGRGTVFLSVHRSGEDVRITVKDDGIGFDPVSVKARSLENVRARIKEVGGDLFLQSKIGEGTEITVVLRGVYENHDCG